MLGRHAGHLGVELKQPIGNGSTASSNVPVAVTTAGTLAGKAVVAVAAGLYHNLVLCSDGTLAAWGSNADWQLGNGTNTSSNVPVAVGTTGVLHGKTVIAIAAGGNHNLALCSDGTLAAWGHNYNGQLGIGNTASATVPVAINSFGALAGKTVIAVAAGSYHSLVLCSDGTLVAWGANSSGMLGDGGTTQSTLPLAVAAVGALAGKTVVTVAAGSNHSMALCSDGTLATWGYNGYGQLGDGSTTSSSVPVAASTMRVVSGGRFVAATSGQGANHSLGIIAEPPAPRIAVEQPAGTDLTNGTSTVDFGTSPVGIGVSRTFTIKNSGSLDLTNIAATFDGVNGSDFTLATAPAATLVPGASTTLVVTFTPGSIATRNGTLHIESNDPIIGAFAVILTGGANGALEASYSTGLEVPLSADSITATGNTVNLRLNYAPTNGTTLTVVKNTGLGFIQGAFGNLAQGQAVALTFAGSSYNFVANYYGGSGNDLVLHWAATRLLAWGANASGMLGNNGTMQSTVPAAVDSDGILSGKTVIAVTTGAASTVALCADGQVAAWGSNIYGQLGNNSTTQSKVPIAVDQTGVLSGKTVIAIAAGGYHHLALCADGTIAAWGRGVEGQLGANSPTNSLVPVAVSRAVGSALSNKMAVAVAAGAYHSLALCSDGTVVAWGYNQTGQLGDNTTTQRNVPVMVRMDMGTSGLAGSKAIAVAAGSAHSLALCSNGTLAAWGNNSYGQLGDGSTGQSSVPVIANAWGSTYYQKTITAVAAGQFHNLALCSDNTLIAWGLNENGQLGDNTTTQRNKPVAVNAIAGGSALSGRMITAVAAGSRHSLALCADGVLTAWGSNTNGQLGDNTTTQRTVPVLVSTEFLPLGAAFVNGTSGQSAYHSLAMVADLLAPGIAVESPAGVGLTDDASTVDFGAVTRGGSTVRTFTIRNPGNAPLDSLFIATDGNHADEFIVGPLGTTTLVAGAATTFSVTFFPAGLSVRTAALHIVSNVTGSSNPFDIALTGSGTDLTQIEHWRLTYFQTTDNAGKAADTATPQNDGILNLIKFATGMNPGLPGTMPGACTYSGGNLVFTYSRSKAAVSDGITFAVEWSDTLASATWSHDGVNEADVDKGATHLVTATLPAGAGPARFVRLRVERK
jgi:alpha-tubulin suppressor-like RCC1 family protein